MKTADFRKLSDAELATEATKLRTNRRLKRPLAHGRNSNRVIRGKLKDLRRI